MNNEENIELIKQALKDYEDGDAADMLGRKDITIYKTKENDFCSYGKRKETHVRRTHKKSARICKDL